MYIRIKTRPNTNKKAVQIVKTIRLGKKVSQKVVQTVGYAFDEDTLNRIKDVAEYIKANLEAAGQPDNMFFSPEQLAEMAIQHRKKKEEISKNGSLNVDLAKLKEVERTIIGIHEVFGEVYKLLGFDKLFTKSHLSAQKELFHVVMARLANPLSKRASVSMLAQDFGVQLNLDKVYRMMDKLDSKAVEKVQKIAYNAAKKLLNEKISVLFYDCTTLYFESFIPDELKQNGYSKDLKFNQPQVILALVVTTEGLPIGYEVFPGSTFEGRTLIPIIKKLKDKYDLNQVVFVSDSGLLSRENRKYLEKENIQYILGARLKNTPQVLQKKIIDKANYRKEEGEETLKAEFTHEGQRLITHYNAKRAAKDEKERLLAIEKLRKKLSKKKDPFSLLNNYGYKKYLTASGNSELKLNEEKIERDAKWDGIKGVITNVTELTPGKIIEQYRNLWQIENCFRVQKTDLRIRPIFHWTPKRIRAHIVICFIAFTCYKYLAYRMKLAKMSLSLATMRNALTHVQLSILQDTSKDCYYGLPSRINEEAKKLYKALNVKYDTTPFLIEKK